MIYELCFVRDKIEFEEFYTDETPEEWMQDRRLESLTLRLAKPNEKPLLEYNGLSFVHRVEPLMPIDGRSHWDDFLYNDRRRSYRIFRGTVDPPCLRIFHTNRFVYKEAATIFYGKNVFTFPSRRCEVTLNACSAFLTDRPDHALPYIKNISLSIGYIRSFNLMEKIICRGAHHLTVKLLGSTLRHLVHLNHLRLLVEEQPPANGMRKRFKEDLGYVEMSVWADALRLIKIPKTLEVESIGSCWVIFHEMSLNSLIYSVTGKWRPGSHTYISSALDVRNEEGREMFSTRVVCKHPTKARSSSILGESN